MINESTGELGGARAASSVGKSDHALVDLELEREKIGLERERLAHEREKLTLERMRLSAESDVFLRKRRVLVSPLLGVAIALLFLLVGLLLGGYVFPQGRVTLGARSLDGPILLKSTEDGTEREAEAYILFVR